MGEAASDGSFALEIEHQLEGPDHVVRHDAGIVLRFRRVKEGHDDVTALVRISTRGCVGYMDADLFDGKLILTGPRSKADAIQACSRRVPEFEGWPELIEKACQRVRVVLEEGEPIINLADVAATDEAAYVLHPFLREREHAVLFGKGGSAKSTIGLLLSILYTEGIRRLGIEARGKGRVLYLDYEDDEENMARRLRALASGINVACTPAVFYKRGTSSLPNMADELGRQIAQGGYDGLVVDSAALACGADPEKSETAIAYFNALRSMRLKWSLTIAHQSKAMDEKEPMPFGSVFWWNSPRMIWQARAARNEGADDLHVGLWNRRNSNGALAGAMGFHVRYSPGCAALTPEPPRQVEDFREHLNNREKILAAFEESGKAMSYAELVEATGIKDASIRKTMQRLGTLVMKDGERFRLVHEAGA